MFDYGSVNQNLKYYNQPTPPLYNIANINVPVALYYGTNDMLANVADIQFLRNNLPYIVDDLNIEFYNHMDFIWASNAKQVLYDRMIQLMSNYY